MKKILFLASVLILAGCVNLHVHFPETSGKAGEPAPAGAAK